MNSGVLPVIGALERWQTTCLARAASDPLTRSTRELAAEITRYCVAHPGARDTVEGIAWWLAMQRSRDTLEELRSAVNSLVDQKVLVAYRLNDGTTVYGCPADERTQDPES